MDVRIEPYQHDPSIGFSLVDFGVKACLPERLTPSDQRKAEQVIRSVLARAGCFDPTVEIARQRDVIGHDGIGPHWELIATGEAPVTCCSSKIADIYDLTGLYGYEMGLN